MSRLSSLIKPIEEQSDEELLARLQSLRHRRDVVRPAVQAKKAEKKASNKAVGNLQKMLEGMSEEERVALMKQLEEGK